MPQTSYHDPDRLSIFKRRRSDDLQPEDLSLPGYKLPEDSQRWMHNSCDFCRSAFVFDFEKDPDLVALNKGQWDILFELLGADRDDFLQLFYEEDTEDELLDLMSTTCFFDVRKNDLDREVGAGYRFEGCVLHKQLLQGIDRVLNDGSVDEIFIIGARIERWAMEEVSFRAIDKKSLLSGRLSSSWDSGEIGKFVLFAAVGMRFSLFLSPPLKVIDILANDV